MRDLTRISSVKEIKGRGTERIEAMRKVVQDLNDAGLRQTLLYTNMAASIKATKASLRQSAARRALRTIWII